MRRPTNEMMSSAPFARIRLFVRGRALLLGQIGWVGGSFAAQQVLRLATNVALAWLLAPALLGTMLLINTLRTGAELLTDVGIGQSIVNNPRGEDPDFLTTAWTMKIVRGFVLCSIGILAMEPLAYIYEDPDLRILIAVTAGIFVVSGFSSISPFVLQKRMDVRKIALFHLGMSAASLVIHVALALVSPTIWALIGGLWFTTIISASVSFFLVHDLQHRLRFDHDAAREIFNYGKWIFAASLIYFLAMNFDRLYFASAIPYATLGVYGIARTLSETIAQAFQRVGTLLVFPKVSATSIRGADLRMKIMPLRWIALLAMAIMLAFAVAIADIIIILAYDDRYVSAGIFLTILLFGTWFAVLGALSDAMMMGVGKPSTVATSNFAKFTIVAATLPVLLPRYGIVAALLAFVGAEAARYGVLVWQKRTVGLGFTRQDLIATALFIGLALLLRELTGIAGLTSGIAGWIEAARYAVATL